MLKVNSNYYDHERQVHITTVIAYEPNFQNFSAEFKENLTGLSDEEIIKKTLEYVYRKYMLGKFVNEAVEITEANAKEAKRLTEQIKESADLLEQLKKANEEYKQKMAEMTAAIEESNQSTTRNNELIKTVSLTINELIAELMGGEEDDEVSEED